MRFMSFYIDCAERTTRAEVLTFATSDALFFVDGRNHDIAAIMVERNHCDCSCWTFLCAESTWMISMYSDAVAANPYSVTDLC